MDDEQVVRCTEELTRFKIAWEAAATQACYERHRGEKCWHNCSTYKYANPETCGFGSVKPPPPCATHYADCPLHAKDTNDA